jgi:hypothetical protein
MKSVGTPVFYPQVEIYLTGGLNAACFPHNPDVYYTEKHTFVKPSELTSPLKGPSNKKSQDLLKFIHIDSKNQLTDTETLPYVSRVI